MKTKTEKLLTELNSENGPVYSKVEDLEPVELEEGEVELTPSTFGPFLSIVLKDKSRRLVNIRGVNAQTDASKLGSKFMLQLNEAIRELPATASRKAIPKGMQKIFAIQA